MPVIQLKTNKVVDENKRKDILLDTANMISETLNKPIDNIMVMLNNEDFLMERNAEPAAFADIKFVSSEKNLEKNKEVCERMLDILKKYLEVKPERVYIFINEVSRESAWKYVGSEG